MRTALSVLSLSMLSLLSLCGCMEIRKNTAIKSETYESIDTCEMLILGESIRQAESTTISTSIHANAREAYRELLLGIRTCTEGIGIFSNCGNYPFDESEFTIIDINHDGIPELHFRARYYEIYTYYDDEIRFVDGYPRETELLNNLAIYTEYWAHNNEGSKARYYIEFSSTLEYSYYLFFEEDAWNKRYRISRLADTEPLYIAYEDFAEITSPIIEYCIDTKNHDMISWTNYKDWLESNNYHIELENGCTLP